MKDARATQFRVDSASFVASATGLASLPEGEAPEIAFGGRSNVGKSSLLNTLFSRKKLVRTSSTPGATRAVNLFQARVHSEGRDVDLMVTDLPGYGFAARSREERKSWGPMVEQYLERREALRALVVIVDVRRGVEDEERQLFEFMEQVVHKPCIVVATKLDKLPSSRRKAAVLQIQKDAGCKVTGFSAESGEGREALWGRLLALVVEEPEAPSP